MGLRCWCCGEDKGVGAGVAEKERGRGVAARRGWSAYRLPQILERWDCGAGAVERTGERERRAGEEGEGRAASRADADCWPAAYRRSVRVGGSLALHGGTGGKGGGAQGIG
jgi:hypothetical protein